MDIRIAFGGARWIWYTGPYVDNVNSWMQARRVFRIKRVSKALLNITADSRYRLYVNGRYISRGPARGFQNSWPFDTVDITEHLVRGVNVVAVLAHSLGISNCQYVHAGCAGLLASGKAGSCDLATGSDWKVRRAPEFAKHPFRESMPMGFQEHFDARLEDAWREPGYDDSAWKPADRGVLAGNMPWPAAEPRDIPMLREEIILPRAVVSRSECRELKAPWETRNVTEVLMDEHRRWRAWPLALRPGKSGAAFTAQPAGKGRAAAWCIDFGCEVVGSVRLDIRGAVGGEIVDYLPAEQRVNHEPSFSPPGYDNCFSTFGNRLVLRSGATRMEQFALWGFRYLVLAVRKAARPLRIAVSLRKSLYPMDVRADFASSDERLNRIWEICVRSQQCCMLDAYVDCPSREQAQWWGDARVQARNTFVLSADARLLRRGIRQIGTQQLPNGLTYGHAPTVAHNCILPDFTLTWIMTHEDYYRQTGDLSRFREFAPRVKKALDYFRAWTSREGLVGYDDRYWLFLDWADIYREGYPTLYNIFYLMALESAARLFALSGDRNASRLYAGRSRASRRAILSRLFDRKTGRFHGGLDRKLRPVRQNSAHVYAMAILAGLQKSRHDDFVRRHLLPLVRGHFTQPGAPSPFFMHYIFEALRQVGEGAAVVDCIRRWWGTMLDQGLSATREMWTEKSSLCHAWSAHPIVHLSGELLGITQASVGWKSVRFQPALAGVDRAQGKVATPLGVIESGWEKTASGYEARLRLPKGVTAEVVLPGMARRTVKGAGGSRVFRFSSRPRRSIGGSSEDR